MVDLEVATVVVNYNKNRTPYGNGWENCLFYILPLYTCFTNLSGDTLTESYRRLLVIFSSHFGLGLSPFVI